MCPNLVPPVMQNDQAITRALLTAVISWLVIGNKFAQKRTGYL